MSRAGGKDNPVYAFQRVGTHLVPEMDYDISALDGIAESQRVRVEIKQWRQSSRLRAYWRMLNNCIKATDCAPTKQALHRTIKLGVGLVDHVKLKDGTIEVVPSSVSLDSMPEDEFIAYFAAAERWLAENIGFSDERQNEKGVKLNDEMEVA